MRACVLACVRERRVVEAVCVSTSKCECVRVAFVLKYKFFSRYTTFTPPLLLLLCALRRRPRHVILFLVMIYARAFLYIRVELQIRTRVYKHILFSVSSSHTLTCISIYTSVKRSFAHRRNRPCVTHARHRVYNVRTEATSAW